MAPRVNGLFHPWVSVFLFSMTSSASLADAYGLVIFTLDRNGAKFILELSEYNLSRAVFQQSDLITVGIIIRARPKKP